MPGAPGAILPDYGPRQVGRPNTLAPYLDYLRERVCAFPELTATRLTREIRKRGYFGAYTAVKRFVAAIRPHDGRKPFEVPFETPFGHRAQVDFARFVTTVESRFGQVSRLPGTIEWLSDNGSGYIAHETKAMAPDIGLEPRTPPVQSPPSNGMGEGRRSLTEPEAQSLVRGRFPSGRS